MSPFLRRIARVVAVPALLAALLVGSSAPSTADVLDSFVVTFDAPPTAEQLETLEGVALGVHGFEHVPAAAVVLDPTHVDLVANLPDVLGVFPNRSMQKLLRQSTRTMRADAAWASDWTGAGVGVAIIDTGIDGTHPDLCAHELFCNGTPVKTVQNVKILGRQSVLEPVVVLEDQITTDTSSGHGTHVAGIAAGAGVGSLVGDDYRGVAPGADLIGLGVGEAIEAVNVLAAFDWVIDNAAAYNIRAVNNSWGPGPGTPYDPADPVNLAIEAAHAAGIAVVFGAGNGGTTTDTLNAFSVNPKAISVAGGDKTGHIAFFSSRGVPGSDLWRPDVTAPGYMIAAPRSSTGFYGDLAGLMSPNPDPVAVEDEPRYVTSNGTSMASPHVAGLVALMQQAAHESRGVWLTPDEALSIMQHTAVSDDPTRGPGGRPNYQTYTMGAGYIDAAAATAAAAAGLHTTGWDDGMVTDVRTFAGTVGPAAIIPTQTFETTIDVLPGAISLNVMADWQVAANDIDLDLYRPDGTLALSTFLRCAPDAEPNGYSSYCSQIANERLTVVAPAAGTWRAVVKGGLAATLENVTGAWSVDYPDTTVLPAPPAPTTIAVTADPVAIGATGSAVALAATVTDAAGNPVPNADVTWSSSGVGSVATAETATHLYGWAGAQVTSDLPGTQTVTVTAGGASATIDVTWLGLVLPAPASTPGRASGGGWVTSGGTRANFGFFGEYASGAPAPGGELNVKHGTTTVTSDGVDRITISGSTATVTGPAVVNGTAGYRYRIEVADNGEPGRLNDTFQVVVTHPLNLLYRYEVSGTLQGGNLQVAAG
jgi:serine protease AprX